MFSVMKDYSCRGLREVDGGEVADEGREVVRLRL